MNIIKPILSYFNHNWGENLNIPLVPIGPLHEDKLYKLILSYIDITYGENITISYRRSYSTDTFMQERRSDEYLCKGRFFCRIEQNKIQFHLNIIETLILLFDVEKFIAHSLLHDWFIYKSKTMDTSNWTEIDSLLHNKNIKKMARIITPYEELLHYGGGFQNL
jgi:hypothetical protein